MSWLLWIAILCYSSTYTLAWKQWRIFWFSSQLPLAHLFPTFGENLMLFLSMLYEEVGKLQVLVFLDWLGKK